MSRAWAFGRKNDLDRTFKSVRVTERITSTFGSDVSATISARYARITELIEGETKVAKGIAVKWNSENNEFEDNEDGAVYDNESLIGEGDEETEVTVQFTTNITSPSDLSVDQIVRLQFYPGLSDDSHWLVLETGSAAPTVLLDVLEFDEETEIYTANILDNPTDRNATIEAVIVKTLQGTSNFDSLVGQPMFSPQSYTEDIPESEQEEPEEGEEIVTTRKVYYVDPPILY